MKHLDEDEVKSFMFNLSLLSDGLLLLCIRKNLKGLLVLFPTLVNFYISF